MIARILVVLALLTVTASAETTREFITHSQTRALAPVSFEDADGVKHSLSEFRGQLVLVNMWATWCLPCRTEMPSLDRLQAKFAGRGLAVLPLSIDRLGATWVKRFYERLEIRHLPILVTDAHDLVAAFGEDALPSTFLIGPDGREIGRLVGAAQWDSPANIELIEQFLR
ncbi:MAG: TlpA family protein disulfide reductase [Alphaproteobacteria bacterium]|nr:TlpA family protein disulfide reductase [Alphaproteobacteria bacterium]